MVLSAYLAVLPACTDGLCSAFTATYLDTFDTVLTVTVGAATTEEATAHTRAIHDLVCDLHRQFDIYHAYDGQNNLYTVNAAAGGEPVTVSNDVMAILELGVEMYAATDGMVNICLGAVTSLWHDGRASGTLPDPDVLKNALANHCDIGALELDAVASTARLTDPNASLDVGAIAKGYAMSRVQALAAERGIDSLLVNLGGHVMAIGYHPNGDPWEVSVVSPMPDGEPTILAVTNASVVTSGDYERTYTVDGIAYHHVIDPTTGYPSIAHHAATLVLPLSHTAEADAYSTAAMIGAGTSGCRAVASIPGARIILDGREWSPDA